MQVSINLPYDLSFGEEDSPEAVARELRLAAAIKWFEQGRFSQGRAAEVAGLSRAEFLDALARYEVSPFQITSEELAEELDDE